MDEESVKPKRMQVVIDGYPALINESAAAFVRRMSEGLTIVSASHCATHGGRVHVLLVLSGTEEQVQAHRARLAADADYEVQEH